MGDRDFTAVKSSLQAQLVSHGEHQKLLFDLINAIGANDIQALYRYFTKDAELHIYSFSGMTARGAGASKWLTLQPK